MKNINGVKFILVFATLLLTNLSNVWNLILSKSKIEMCENRGLHGQGDPQNLVDGKMCQKKMVVLMSVNNNQKEGTEKLFATVSRVRDETSNEYARLYNPFMITISKSPVLINYPFFYTGFNVNNRPYEEVLLAKGHWTHSDSSKRCYDQWQDYVRPERKPTCGYDYQDKKKTVRLWDSQGFCCHCTTSEKHANLNDEAKNYKRSGISCKLFTSRSQAAAHCMRMDDLWYTVNSFTESYRDFTIHIKAYDQVEKVLNNETVTDYVNGGEIILSPRRKAGVGKYERIIAHYIGDFAPVKSYPVLSERYLLIPKADDTSVDYESHSQVKHGASKFLILPMSFFDLRGGGCNKIGVTHSAFKNQAAGGIGFGCQQKKGYCLENQPFHFFTEDQNRLDREETPLWFPTRYGKLSGLKKAINKTGPTNSIISFELEEDHVSLITLQISADDVIFVYNRATGEIIRAAVRDFEALSLDGKLQVEVLNTGYVTSSFYVTIDSCSSGLHMVEERAASIDPQQTQNFVFKVKTTTAAAADFQCVVHLYDSRRALLSERNVSFSTSNPCTCEVMGCRCECKSDGGVDCIKNTGKFWINPELHTVTKSSKGFWGNVGGWFGSAFKSIGSFFGNFFGLGKYLKLIVPILVAAFCLCIFFNCGGPMLIKSCLKAPAMLRFKNTVIPDKVRAGWRQKKERNRQKKLSQLSSDEDEDDENPPPGYNDAVRPRGSRSDQNGKKKAGKSKDKNNKGNNDEDSDDDNNKKKGAGSSKKNKSPDKHKIAKVASGSSVGPKKSNQMMKNRDDVVKSRIQGRYER